jgi:hypothetical protein
LSKNALSQHCETPKSFKNMLSQHYEANFQGISWKSLHPDNPGSDNIQPIHGKNSVTHINLAMLNFRGKLAPTVAQTRQPPCSQGVG